MATTSRKVRIHIKFNSNLEVNTVTLTPQTAVETPIKQHEINYGDLVEYIKKGDIGEVKRLLLENNDPNKTAKYGSIGLRAAIDADNMDIFNTLIEEKANIDEPIENGFEMSPLCYACYYGKPHFIKRLVELGAKVNQLDNIGDNSLANLCRREDFPEMVEFLIKNGADYELTNKRGETPLILANKHSTPKSAKVIEKHLEDKRNFKNSKLLMSANDGSMILVEDYLTQGCDPNAKTQSNETCLMYAIRDKDIKMVKLLVKYGAKIENTFGVYDYSALSFACYQKATNIVEYLIGLGANLHHEDRDGDTCLHNACRGDINTEIIKLLLKNGAKWNIKNKYADARTPLEWAKAFDKKDAVETIENFIYKKIRMHIRKGESDEVKKMLTEGCDPNYAPPNKFTYFGVAILHDKLDIIKILVEAKADINKHADTSKNSPLNMACRNSDDETIKYLLGLNDIKIDDVNESGNTPLHRIAVLKESPEITELLLKKGANYNLKNGINKTALEYAQYLGVSKTAKVIEEFIKSKEVSQNIQENEEKIEVTLTKNGKTFVFKATHEEIVELIKELNKD